MQSGAGLTSGSEFVYLGGFLENSSLLDNETIWGMWKKASIKIFQNGQTNKSSMKTGLNKSLYPLIGPLVLFLV